MVHLTPKITAQSKLEELAIPHWSVVLEEVFLLVPTDFYDNPPPQPHTVGELAVASALTVDEVLRRLRSLLAMSAGIEISPQELAARLAPSAGEPRPEPAADSHLLVLLDVRAAWEFEVAHIPGSLLLASLDFPVFLQSLLASQPEVITICHHGVRSYSAAMYLKQQGLTRVRSLAGGVEAWALAIDASLKRY